MKWLPILLCFLGLNVAHCQEQVGHNDKSTDDLSFLVGKWEIKRTYTPDSEKSRIMEGNLECGYTLNNQFIKCIYTMQRPVSKNPAIDEVYFNFNGIYDSYESLWLSSTWPIKVLLRGNLTSINDSLKLDTNASFLIENGIMEYVKDEMFLEKENPGSFVRKTYVRTSKVDQDTWMYHLLEEAKQIN